MSWSTPQHTAVDADVALAAHRARSSREKLSLPRRVLLNMVGGEYVRDAENLVSVVADHDTEARRSHTGGPVTRWHERTFGSR